MGADLRVREVLLEHPADVLCVRQVQGGVHLVQDVERRGAEQQQRQHQGQRHQRPLTPGQLAQGLLPRVVEPDLHLTGVQRGGYDIDTINVHSL